MNYLGLDPGKAGGVAVLDAEGMVVELRVMPTVRASRGRPEVDVPALVGLIASHRLCFVTAEKLQPMPSKLGGGAANFARGYGRGLVEGVCAALEVPLQLVSPRRWQGVMLEGTPGEDTKARSIIAAGRLFPGVSLLPTPRCRKPHDGLADALLLAEYGRRVHVGRREVA